MKPRTVIILAGIGVFLVAVALTLVREVDREQAKLRQSISGLAEVSEVLIATGQAELVRTDRLVLLLVDPRTGEAVASKSVSPFIPPLAVSIGQEDARGGIQLEGAYYLMGITDKDGDLGRPTRGEVTGRSPAPIHLGQEQALLLLDQPFRGQVPPFAQGPPQAYRSGYSPATRPRALPEWAAVRVADSSLNPCAAAEGGGTMIEGWITVPPELAGRIAPDERLVIRILVPGEPAMTRAFVYPGFSFPLRFRVGPSTNMSGQPPRRAYVVEAFTSAEGAASGAVKRLAARTGDLIPLGTAGLQLELRPASE